MLLTDRFVFIHLPKTGGTFVTKIVQQIHAGKDRPLLERLRTRRPFGPAVEHDHKHAPCSRIPASHRSLPIVSSIRNPFEYYVSHYAFGIWRKAENNPEWAKTDWERIHREFPHFPDLTFGEYLTVWGTNHYGKTSDQGDPHGAYTSRFVSMYALDSDTTYKRLDEPLEGLEHEFHAVRYLPTEDLNAALHTALIDLGYPPDAVAFVRAAAPILPTKGGRSAEQRWRSYYDDGLIADVRQRDEFLFRRFPEYESLA